MKIKGVSIWIWGMGLAVFSSAGLVALPIIREATKPLPIEIVKDELWKSEGSAEVRGQICNPRKTPARNVTVTYKLTVIDVETNSTKSAGTASAVIQYVPAGKTLDFVARSDYHLRKWDAIQKSNAVIAERE